MTESVWVVEELTDADRTALTDTTTTTLSCCQDLSEAGFGDETEAARHATPQTSTTTTTKRKAAAPKEAS